MPSRSHIPHLAPASHALLSTRQFAYAFNQPLSFDTSSVTNMNSMFAVRSAWTPPHTLLSPPLLQSLSFPAPSPPVSAPSPPTTRPAPRIALRTPSRSHPAPHLSSHALLSTRQTAIKFNQPLSFDTSSVMTTNGMFSVRSPRVPSPQPSIWPAPRPSSHALLSTRQRAWAFNQPLSFDTSSVTDMRDMFDVRSPRVYPATTPRVGSSACAPLAPAAALRPSFRAFRPAPRPAYRMPSFRLGSPQTF